jgi:hypothetical protein
MEVTGTPHPEAWQLRALNTMDARFLEFFSKKVRASSPEQDHIGPKMTSGLFLAMFDKGTKH